MIAVTPREVAALRARDCMVIFGNDMLALMESAKTVRGPVLLIETRAPILDRRGYELETKSFGFASLRDGVLMSYVGFNQARHRSPRRLQDERIRKWVLQTVTQALWRKPSE